MPATMSSSSADAPKTANGTSAAALSDSDKAVLVIKKLLAHGALIDTVDIYGNNPVMLLAERGYLGGIDTIMEADSNIDLNARNWQRGMSALALAAKSGRVNVVEGLLDYGAQVDIRTLHGETPLHFAAASATQRVCQLLVEKGCKVDVRTSEGLTPLMIAVARGRAGTEAGFYARRMVLSALSKLVEILKHSVECDMDVCNYVAESYAELVPLQDELSTEDPQCAQWLSASLLPEFADACTSNRMQEFQVLSFCEGDYPSLKQFICTAKQANPNLAFLDDELFGAASGMEIITETMRRRMSLAGVWKTGEVKGSFVVKAEERLDGVLILDLDPSIIAQQITLMQHYLFSKIKVSEVLASKRNAEKTPGYQRLRLLHNHISIWVVGQILMRGDVDQRAEILAYFIRVAGVLLSPLQNLDGFMAVMNAANDSSVFRLKKTWGRLPPQARDLWQELVPLTENGARPLNKLTKEATPPLIPYMGMVIQNVIALQEYPDRVEGDLINFKKIRSIGFLIQRMLSFQKTPYLLPTNKRVLVSLVYLMDGCC
ncbi:hypothetical protein BBJ29_008405 [Phytophthora kernoviae]|uniref:Ras-GEF domain-containing protein n=2 Tax=Phytophthora kernoviae TaxID=325452 RepID=A0A3F2S181_9STRA|nr:hypothetical protein BBJ29_008405 [Phytophthora kernoviae]RLN68343.1 hypothetical protein BBP00_00001116 [Phytophthora kernoviae]